jgi:hypothetical protein
MTRLRMSAHGIAFVLSLIVLPLTALVCSSSPPQVQGSATGTATASPAPALPVGSGFSLQISWEGSYSLPNGLLTAKYGPDSVTIPLKSSGSTFAGSYEGVWHANVTGTCTATGKPPVAFDVTAKVGQSGGLDFSVKRSIVWSWDTVCPGVSGGSASQRQTYTYAFTLSPQDGASKTFNQGGPTWTFVLKKQGP